MVCDFCGYCLPLHSATFDDFRRGSNLGVVENGHRQWVMLHDVFRALKGMLKRTTRTHDDDKARHSLEDVLCRSYLDNRLSCCPSNRVLGLGRDYHHHKPIDVVVKILLANHSAMNSVMSHTRVVFSVVTRFGTSMTPSCYYSLDPDSPDATMVVIDIEKNGATDSLPRKTLEEVVHRAGRVASLTSSRTWQAIEMSENCCKAQDDIVGFLKTYRNTWMM